MKLVFLLLNAVLAACAVEFAAAQCAWEPGPTFPAGPRIGASAVNLDGTIVVLGGRPFVGENAAVDYLPPGAPAWLAGPPLDGLVVQPASGIDALGRIVVYGGYTIEDHFPYFFPLTNGYVYDPVNGVGGGIAGFNFARAFFAFATDAEGRFYAIGGLDLQATTTDFVERYEATSDTWETLAPLPDPRSRATAVFDDPGRILVIGGADVSGIPQTSVLAYDIAGNSWSPLAPQPAALEEQVAVRGANGLIYVLGGASQSGSESSAVFIYDPAADRWLPGPALAIARRAAAAALADDGLIWAMGGFAGSLGTDTVERLDTTPPDVAEDCNADSISDACDIAWGISEDLNQDGIPDECQVPNCPGDLDGDGDVDLSDLAALLASYGATSGMTYADGDLDGDGDVDLSDLAALLAVYGTVC